MTYRERLVLRERCQDLEVLGYDEMGWPIPTEPRDPNVPAPFDFRRLYSDEKYSLQNMLLAQYNAPNQIPEGSESCSVWSDHAYQIWEEAGKDITSSANGDAFWSGVPARELIAFAQRVAEKIGVTGECTGCRIVRYTNVSSGYPALRLDIIHKTEPTSRRRQD